MPEGTNGTDIYHGLQDRSYSKDEVIILLGIDEKLLNKILRNKLVHPSYGNTPRSVSFDRRAFVVLTYIIGETENQIEEGRKANAAFYNELRPELVGWPNAMVPGTWEFDQVAARLKNGNGIGGNH
ncbi:MAG TPA: hypothetical protein ENI23_06320 [bacterium]|nr:hypothetical protein [bacterium]